MALPRSEARRQLVLEVAGDPPVTFTVATAADGDRAVDAIRAVLRLLVQRGGCRSMVIAVHVEGAECDHQLTGTST